MQLLNWLAQHATIINPLWLFTLISMAVLYVICNLLPDRIVGNFLPLHNVFKPRTNIDLDYQSIGYAMLHTKWINRFTHYSIGFDVILWFVIFESWHWSVPFIVLALILVQSLLIGDIKFGLCFVLMSAVTFAGALGIIHFAGMQDAALLAKVVLMADGLMRMVGHSAEFMPPLLLDDTDRFVKLTPENINYKIPLAAAIGYVAEFGSGLPTRLFPVQVNFVYQRVFRGTPRKGLSWSDVEASAKKALTGGYYQLETLGNYYNSVTKSE